MAFSVACALQSPARLLTLLNVVEEEEEEVVVEVVEVEVAGVPLATQT